jgi:nucleoside-diphosphate-sugar epimerase
LRRRVGRSRGAHLRRALITGGAGFIGFHLASKLVEDGWDVDLFDSFARGARDEQLQELAVSPRVRLLERDLTTPEALRDGRRDYTHVFHLAAIVGVSHVLSRPYEVLRDNAAMLTAVLELARGQEGLERLVFASTSEVYAGTLRRDGGPLPTPEDVALTLPDLAEPRVTYLLSKIHGEAMCLHSGLPITIVRPHNVYGPRMGLAHVVPELLERAHAAGDRDSLEVFSVEHRRTFCFVGDAVELLARAAVSEACIGEVLNVGADGPEVSIGELAQIVLRVVGRDLEVVPGPETAGSPPRRLPDMTKATRMTGYRAGVDLETGVRLTYDWYRARGFAGAGTAVR